MSDEGRRRNGSEGTDGSAGPDVSDGMDGSGESGGLDDDVLPSTDGDDEPAFAEDVGSPDSGADRAHEPVADAPLGDLADRARRRRDEDRDDDAMAAFSEVDVGEVDVDRLWSELEDDRIAETVDDPQGDAERDVRVVGKRDYCQRCQYFSDPPEVRCTHEDGEILKMVDTEQFEVADCPILRGVEDLENLRR